ncbi:DegV family protein [Eubacteriales bacterium OttesenSCG-928-M02]|nr:DegV family protein [Eubacteriales bacterium OttesenSCG-928-M02]
MRPIILSADSTCDIGPALQERYQVRFFNYRILLDGREYVDMVDISPEEIYAAWREKGILPKTSAITPIDYFSYFRTWVEDGMDVIHFNLGSALSSSYQNCKMVADNLNMEMPGKIYLVDSQNLSTGIGNLVLRAGQWIEESLEAKEIYEKILALVPHSHASFLLDTLEFMQAGGRCTALTALSASLLHIKPCIRVDSQSGGSMGVGKKYQGSMQRALKHYIKDELSGKKHVDPGHVFITHSGSPEEDIQQVKKEIQKHVDFKNVYVTRASSTISSHCGPRTLGILYLTLPK